METLNLLIEDIEFQLFAINTTLDDYKLAYLINKELNVHLKTSLPDIDISFHNNVANFSLYHFKDTDSCTEWYLVQNKCKITVENNKTNDLFSNSSAYRTHTICLQEELNKSDFLLKIEGDISDELLKSITKQINNIKGVVTAYEVDTQKLKNKEYLIF